MSTRVSRPSEAAALILGLALTVRSACEVVSVQTNFFLIFGVCFDMMLNVASSPASTRCRLSTRGGSNGSGHMAFVYILLSQKINITYTGSTINLERRIAEHNNGNNFSTKKYIPWKLFYKEEYPTLLEARKREKYLKTCAGRKFIKKLFKLGN